MTGTPIPPAPPLDEKAANDSRADARNELGAQRDAAPGDAEMTAPSADQEDAQMDSAPVAAAEVDQIDPSFAVDAELRRLTRRGFLIGGVAAAAGFAGWEWLRTRPREEGIPRPFRRMLRFNEALALAYFRDSRLSPTFPPSRVTRPSRVNGGLSLNPAYDVSSWRLHIEGAAKPAELTLDDLRQLPRRTQITELRCIEGWSIVVQWAGVRLADLMAELPPAMDTPYVGMETPDRGYYVGLDHKSAIHPQTLLAYEMNGAPLTWQHGAPLRLAIPVKYGVKNIKRIGTIRYTAVRPADFWAEQGYDWYAGH